MNRRYLLVLLISAALGGCATLNQAECQSADWQMIGYNDGVAGRSSERLEQHREACAEYGITPILDHYLTGHYRGASNYCTATNGYNTARSGQHFNSVCSGKLRYDFEHGYHLGSQAYQQVQQLTAAEQVLNDLRRHLRQSRDERDKLEKRLSADGITPEKRRKLLRKIRTEKTEQHHLRSQIRLQQSEVDMERHYLQQLERELHSQLYN